MKKELAEKLYFILIALMVILCIVFTVISSDNDDVNFSYDERELRLLTSDWFLCDIETGESEKIMIPGEFDIEAGETMRIRRIISGVTDDDVICFRTDHTSVKATIDGKVIYSLGWDEDIPLGNTPGSIWNLIELKEEYRGKVLTIDLNCAYSKYSGMIREVVMGKSGDIYLHILKDSMPLFLLSSIPFILGAVLIIVYFTGVRLLRMKEILYLGAYLIINAIWGFTESRFLQFYFGNAYAIQMINFIVFALAPLGAVMALKSINLIRKHFGIVFGIVFGCVVLVVGLQLFEIMDFFETVSIVHISILLGCGIIFLDNYKEYSVTKNKDFKYVFAAFMVLFLCSVLDMIEFYTFDNLGNGFFFRIGSLVFALILGIWAVEQALMVQKDSAEREAFMKMAFTDNLTGLLNRRSFDSDLRDIELDRVKALVVMIDLNNLKKINDNYGHQSGDEAIKCIAEKIKIFRDKYGELCYRTGGDEFCVICKKLTVNEVISICDDINIKLSKENVVDGVILSMAYGYKMYEPDKYDTIEQVVSQADEKMYIKKQKMKAERG